MPHDLINYLELPAKDLEKTKDFFSKLFDWKFTDYGNDYTGFQNAGLSGGFYKCEQSMQQENGSALIIFRSFNLSESLANVKASGGEISKDIFSFPGGERFHFKDPNGNEFAVWFEYPDVTSNDQDTKIELKGECLCKKVSITAKKAQNTIGACHCAMCRKWGGGAFLAIDCGAEVTFSDTQQIQVYNSSEWAERGFCSHCGTHLFYRLKEQKTYHMPADLFFETEHFKFNSQIFIDQKPAYYSFSNQTHNMTRAEVLALYSSY